MRLHPALNILSGEHVNLSAFRMLQKGFKLLPLHAVVVSDDKSAHTQLQFVLG